MRVLIVGLPADSATARDIHDRPPPAPPAPARPTSTPDAIRRAGGKFIVVPKGGD